MNNLILYDWDKVVRENKSNSLKILDSFKSFNKYGVPKKFIGNSFLLNSLSLLYGNNTESEKIDYLYLASLRNYFDYKYQNISGLYLYFSDLATERVLHNTALYIENDYIHFKYEELYGN